MFSNGISVYGAEDQLLNRTAINSPSGASSIIGLRARRQTPSDPIYSKFAQYLESKSKALGCSDFSFSATRNPSTTIESPPSTEFYKHASNCSVGT
jgi:hypothetical protein